MDIEEDPCDCEYHYADYATGCGLDFAVYVNSMSPQERDERLTIDDEIAILDNEHIFIKGIIYLRVIDGYSNEAFAWHVWVNITQETFFALGEHWNTPGRENLIQPQLGVLCSSFIPSYPKTLNLEVGVYTLQLGQPAFIILAASEHPLSIEQRKGITRARREEIERLANKFIKANS